MRRRDLRRFLRFWGEVVVGVPSLVVEAFKRLTLALSVVAVVGITGAAWALRFVPWWVPFVALVVYGLMWSIYDKFDEVRATNDALQERLATSEKRMGLRDRLGEAHAVGDQIRGYGQNKDKALQWSRLVYELVQDARGMGEAELFLSGDAPSDAGDWLIFG